MKNSPKINANTKDFPEKSDDSSFFQEQSDLLALNNVLVSGIDGYWEIDVKKNIIIFSEKWMEMLGYKSENKKNDAELKALIHPDDLPRLEKIQDDIYKGKMHQYKTVHRVKNKSGNYVWLLSRGNVTERNSKNLPVKIVGIDTDITEQKLLENALRQNEKTYQLLAKSIPDTSLLLFNKKLQFVLAEGEENWNNNIDKKLIEGKTIYEIFQQKDINLFEPIYLKALQGLTTEFEHEFEGSAYHRIIQPVKDGSDEIIGGLVISTNITKTKKLETAMVKNQQLHKLLINYIPQSLLIFADRRIDYISSSLLKLLGVEDNRLSTVDDFLIHVLEKDKDIFTRDFHFINGGKKKEISNNIRICYSTGNVKYLKYLMTNETKSNGKNKQVVLIAEDISNITFNEELNHLYASALNHLSETEAITCRIYDLTDKKTLYCSKSFNEYWDIKTGAEITNENIYQLLGNKHAEKIQERIEREKSFMLKLGKNKTDFSEISIHFYPSSFKPGGYFIELAR